MRRSRNLVAERGSILPQRSVAIFAFFGPFAHRWLASFELGIAVWVTISPFVLGFTEDRGATWNNILTGLVMFALTLRAGWLSKEAHDAGALPE